LQGIGLTEVSVRNLEHLFTPPGLPLVSKSAGAPATTSILIRGGAGTGKTTLGAALGHAIARRENGVVLYLTTEFSQTELLYKARLLGLPESMVFRWKDRAAAPPGAIVTEHLALSPAGEGPLTSLARKTESIDTLWDLLHPESGPLDVAVRAVVIDAFTLPDATVEEKTLRSDLVAFVQALEGEGISTVIVEEATEERASWLPFVVDLVFEIAWVADPDSADLHRKLRCSKSRYAQVLAGPHDYGLDMGFPGVWPDLLAVASAPAGRNLVVQRPAALILPSPSSTSPEPHYVRFDRGGVALVEKGSSVSRFLKIIALTPGVILAEVRCGPLNIVSGASLPVPVQVPDSEGAQSLGWALVQAVRAHGVNVVVVHDPEALLRRQRFAIPLLHVIEALRQLGVLVIVHARLDHLEALSSIADVSTNGSSGHAREPRAFLFSRMRRIDIWLSDELTVDEEAVYPQLARAREQVRAQDVAGAHAELLKLPTDFDGVLSRRTLIESGYVFQQIGLTGFAVERMVQGSRYSSEMLNEESLWARALVGQDGPVLSALVEVLPGRPTSSSLAILWASLCAVYAQSRAAIESLLQWSATPLEGLFIGYLLRALALCGDGLEVQATAARVGHQQQLPAWMIGRMHGEALLESPRDAVRVAAFERLVELHESADVPLLHRADIAHNLGMVREDMGQLDEAIQWYQKALALNPFLELTREGLTRLGIPVPPAP
jgi:KaiC/GvpD/RAD55 family RecA-like ATPase/tetratricopeptide (TPR) repeat protein